MLTFVVIIIVMNAMVVLNMWSEKWKAYNFPLLLALIWQNLCCLFTLKTWSSSDEKTGEKSSKQLDVMPGKRVITAT